MYCFLIKFVMHWDKLLNILIPSYIFWKTKVEDILFASGEALSFIWGGVSVTADMILKSNYSSLSKVSGYLTSEISSSITGSRTSQIGINIESRTRAQEVITKKLFDVLLYSSRKEERCAGTVWLVSLLMYCGHHPKIQQLLPEIQVHYIIQLFL